MKDDKILEIDVMKGIAIISVIILHTIPISGLRIIGAEFHIWQAVPIFLVIMGLNFGNSIIKHTGHEEKFLNYFVKKYKRIIVPYIYINIIFFYFDGVRCTERSRN